MSSSPRRLRIALAVVGLAAAIASAAGIGVRSTYGGRAAVDEPQYLLTALSLGEDRDLSIADELAAERWRDFHTSRLPVQTEVLAGGRQVSPHDPLLPLLLAVPMTVGGFVLAKLTLCVLSGLLAALTLWVAVRRTGAPVVLSGVVVGFFATTAPLAVYGQQVYPELPAALAVMAAVAALTGELSRRALSVTAAAVVVLPWLSIKYVPVAAALAAVVLWQLWRAGRTRAAVVVGAALGVAGIAYLAGHRVLYGGWTSYATGDHFQSSGEFGVVGFQPNYLGRSARLVGLLVDRGFGVAAWQPMWLLAIPALAVAVRRRPRWLPAVVVPLLAGYLTATFVAVTMHGFWWPGRQLVVVLPLAVVLVVWWAAQVRRPVRLAALGLGALGALNYLWLVAEGRARQLTWVVDFEEVGSPAYRWLRPLLPDYRNPSAGVWIRHGIWIAVFLALAAVELGASLNNREHREE